MLREEIDKAKRLVNTDTVQISIGEISSMYTSKELDIIPEFQRLFRWSIEKRSSFIESILIGIPIPPAFAYEQDDGTWELIDGLQRISTILEFMGVLEDLDNPGEYKKSVLSGTKYLPSLKGVSWDGIEGTPETSLEKSLQLFFRRARIDFQILKHPSDPKTKFDLFQRLNRGGAYANEQEVRSCSMVLANREFTKSIRALSDSKPFMDVFRINKDQQLNQKNVEYAVRIIVHTFRDFGGESDVQEFLDKSIVDILANENKENVLRITEETISTLHRLFGNEAMMPHDESAEGVDRRFSLRALEGIAVGIARNLNKIQKLKSPDDFIRKRTYEFWKQDEVVQMSASGLRGTIRIQKSVPFGANWFDPDG